MQPSPIDEISHERRDRLGVCDVSTLPSVSSGYSKLIAFLQVNDPQRVAHEGMSVLRVGRNRVWRVETPVRTVFVKIMDTDPYHRRELHGLQLSQRLADQHDWIVAPQLLHSEAEQRALVTSSLPGTSVGRLLQLAFRADRNPLRRTGPVDRFHTALSHVLRWLEHLHGTDSIDPSVLFDHTTLHMRERILSKLRRAVDSGLLDCEDEVLKQFEDIEVPSPETEAHVICGDATLGNFFWDGERVGRIDFEDLGFGAPARDYSEIRQGLEYIAGKPWYRSTRRALELLPASGGGVQDTLYRLEWALDRHWPGGRTRQTRRMRQLRRSIERLVGAVVREEPAEASTRAEVQ